MSAWFASIAGLAERRVGDLGYIAAHTWDVRVVQWSVLRFGWQVNHSIARRPETFRHHQHEDPNSFIDTYLDVFSLDPIDTTFFVFHVSYYNTD